MALTTVEHDRYLERRVTSFLRERNVPGLRQLQVEVQGGMVIVRGHLNSFYEKQLCQHAIQRVAGVVSIVDEVTVA